MKLVINTCYGGFSIPDRFCKELGLADSYSSISRDDERLINLIERNGGFIEGFCSFLEVVEITDEATDYEIFEYDGNEEVICVVNGKLCHYR